jgi:hypothetical protein
MRTTLGTTSLLALCCVGALPADGGDFVAFLGEPVAAAIADIPCEALIASPPPGAEAICMDRVIEIS